jgi:hypothetical protein
MSMGTERRNQSALGRRRRREFERSLHKLRELGMPDWAVEYYRRAARVAGLPPHMVVCHVAVVAAGRQMQSSTAPAGQFDADAEAARDEAAGAAATHGALTEMQRRITGLWREIQRHSARIDGGENPFAAPAPQGPQTADSGKVTLLHHPARDGERPAPRRARKPQAKGH